MRGFCLGELALSCVASQNPFVPPGLRGALAEIALPPGAQLVSAKPRESLGELEGWAYRHTGVSFWPDRKPTDNLAYADWVVRAQPGTTVELTAWHERAGKVRTAARLG